mgnify:FL=1
MNTARISLIKRIVKAYKEQWPDEYALVRKQIALKNSLKRNQWGELQGGPDAIERILLEIPDRLFAELDFQIDDYCNAQAKINRKEPRFLEDDGEWQWFIKAYPEFSRTAKA